MQLLLLIENIWAEGDSGDREYDNKAAHGCQVFL